MTTEGCRSPGQRGHTAAARAGQHGHAEDGGAPGRADRSVPADRSVLLPDPYCTFISCVSSWHTQPPAVLENKHTLTLPARQCIHTAPGCAETQIECLPISHNGH